MIRRTKIEPSPVTSLFSWGQTRSAAWRWIRRPAPPVRYRLPDRLADVYHGYRDGARGLPTVTVPGHGGDGVPIQGHVGTPRLEVLRRLTAERIAGELMQAQTDIVPLSVVAVPEALRLVAVSTERLRMTSAWYELVTGPPTDDQLSVRRLAEEESKRPEALVAARRLAEHRKRELAAEREHLSATEQAHLMQQRLMSANGMIEARMAIARIRAVRLYEHGWRRCATYWQQLVRSHPQGCSLNGLLEPVGPELPEWVLDAGRPGGVDPTPEGGSR
jgi:hypothetical protein